MTAEDWLVHYARLCRAQLADITDEIAERYAREQIETAQSEQQRMMHEANSSRAG